MSLSSIHPIPTLLLMALGAILWRGFDEALLKPMSKKLFKRATNRFLDLLPAMFDDLDHVFPQMILEGEPGSALRDAARKALTRLSDEPWCPEMEPVVGQFMKVWSVERAADRMATMLKHDNEP